MEERKYCVYKHTSPSGKVYIGITTSIVFAMRIEALLAVINGVMPLKITTTGKSYKTQMTDKSVKNRKYGRVN